MNAEIHSLEIAIKRCNTWIMLIVFIQLLTFLVLIISLGIGLPKALTSIENKMEKTSGYLEENINALSTITAELKSNSETMT